MAKKTVKTKRLSPGQRKHVRRMKQAARKASVPLASILASRQREAIARKPATKAEKTSK